MKRQILPFQDFKMQGNVGQTGDQQQQLMIGDFKSSQQIKSAKRHLLFDQQLPVHEVSSYAQSFSFKINNAQPNRANIFPITDIPSPQYMRQFNDQIRNNDLAYFYQLWRDSRCEIIQHLSFLLENWNVFELKFSEHLQNFIHLIDIKIRTNVCYVQLFPELSAFITKIQKRLQIVADRKKAPKCEKKPSDLLFEKYVEEIESLNRRQGAFYIKGQNDQNKVPLGQFISQNAFYCGSNTWRDIYFKIACNKRENQFQIMSANQQILDQKRKRRNFLNKAINPDFNKLTTPLNRICCTTFFYYNFNIYDRVVNNSPLLVGRKLAKLNSAKEICQQELYQIALDIIALLNCGGGVILFNAIRNYLQIWPKGQSIIQSDQKDYIQKIVKAIKNITPPVQLNSQIFITFVPVAKSPYSSGLPEFNEERFYINGLFIMRIVVRPKGIQNFYYFSNQSISCISACLEKEMRKTLKGKQMVKFYKQKLEASTMNEQEEQDQQLKSMISKKINYFQDHQKCGQPEKGAKAYLRQAYQNNADQSIQKFQTKYKYLTLLVAHKNNHSQIKQRLKNRGTECQIVVKYANYKFKAASNAAALYHNERFDRLLTQVSYNKDFQFNGRFILTILVTEYLKLSDRKQNNHFPIDQFKSLQKWLSGEHPKQKLTLWRYSQGQQCQFYLKTQSKISTLYMYYILNQYNEKCIFKNPPNYQKMTAQEKESYIKLFYPTKK